MRVLFIAIFVLLQSSICFSKEYEIITTLDDTFNLSDSKGYEVDVKKYLLLRFADIQIRPKGSTDYNLMLYFKSDTEDLSQFNTPAKIIKSIEASSEKYMPYIVENIIEVNDMRPEDHFGFYTVMTEKN